MDCGPLSSGFKLLKYDFEFILLFVRVELVMNECVVDSVLVDDYIVDEVQPLGIVLDCSPELMDGMLQLGCFFFKSQPNKGRHWDARRRVKLCLAWDYFHQQ